MRNEHRLLLLGCLGLAFTTACGSNQDGEQTRDEASQEQTGDEGPTAAPVPTEKPAITHVGPYKFIEIPFYGVELDAHRLHKCQADGEDCPESLPAEQFACQRSKKRKWGGSCTNSVPDGRCCSFYERVSYNRRFAAELEEHRKKHCVNVSCYEGTGGMGRYRPGCSKGRCVFGYREDDLRPIDL